MYLLALLLFPLVNLSWAFDHGHKSFQKVLSAHVVREGAQTLVNYKSLKDSPKELNDYIHDLSQVSKKDYAIWTTDQKLAALINGYNAWTLKLIISNYPVSSIKEIGPFYSTPWKQEFISWLGRKVSLDHIEHEVIRKKFKEPRIHFALVCAAVGCPSLQENPFLSETLDDQLKKASDDFLNDKNKNLAVITKGEVRLKLSSIFNWYGRDFGSKDDLISYVAMGMDISEKVKKNKVSVSYIDYDWSLNETR